MNIIEFKEKNNCKESVRTIQKWLENGYIRGAKKNSNTDEWVIPNEAKKPYIKRGKITPIGMYKSLARNICKGYDVFAKLYNLSEEEFDIYIDELKKNGFLRVFESSAGSVYYLPTITTQKLENMSTKEIEITFANIKFKFATTC